MRIRLQKAMAQVGVASRRASEKLIEQGRVQVNGHVVTEMGTKIDPEHDIITVDGQSIKAVSKLKYIMLYKPAGFLSVLRDDRGRPALIDLVPNAEGLHPVGRLDLDSEGLILLTNDGLLTQRLTHPRYEHRKEYHVLVQGQVKRVALRTLREGVELEDGKTAPAQVDRLDESPWGGASRGQTWLHIILHQGRKRQIRRMCHEVGLSVQRLIRIRIGPLELQNLSPGVYRPLTRAQVRALRAATEPSRQQASRPKVSRRKRTNRSR
jgi:23S rRNA pseudouridine2605 synthase